MTLFNFHSLGYYFYFYAKGSVNLLTVEEPCYSECIHKTGGIAELQEVYTPGGRAVLQVYTSGGRAVLQVCTPSGIAVLQMCIPGSRAVLHMYTPGGRAVLQMFTPCDRAVPQVCKPRVLVRRLCTSAGSSTLIRSADSCLPQLHK